MSMLLCSDCECWVDTDKGDYDFKKDCCFDCAEPVACIPISYTITYLKTRTMKVSPYGLGHHFTFEFTSTTDKTRGKVTTKIYRKEKAEREYKRITGVRLPHFTF